jgi:hypothetical protein
MSRSEGGRSFHIWCIVLELKNGRHTKKLFRSTAQLFQLYCSKNTTFEKMAKNNTTHFCKVKQVRQ